jgi:hypothetical protein
VGLTGLSGWQAELFGPLLRVNLGCAQEKSGSVSFFGLVYEF